jgi:hypothetical protein
VNQTFSLLRKHPILALPVLAADLISFAAMHIQHTLHQPLFAWVFANKDSVLSTTSNAFVLTPENATKAALLTIPLIWGCYFLTVYLYTGALLTTSTLLHGMIKGQLPNLRFAFVHAYGNRRRLLLFSISFFGALIVAAILVGFSMAVSMKIPWLARMMGRDFGYLIVLPLEIAFVYIFTRPALKLLSLTQAPPLKSIEHIAMLLGLIAIFTQMTFVLLTEHAAPAILFQQKTVAGFLVREAIQSLIGASIYVPLFIGLSLLASGGEQVTPFTGLEEVEQV